MRHCPRCAFLLTPYRHGAVGLDHCHRCDGSFVDPGAAAATFGPAAEPSYWKESFAARDRGPSRLRCPVTGDNLQVHLVKYGKGEVEIDTCPDCKGMWVDRGEGQRLQELVQYAETIAHAKREGHDSPGVITYIFQVFTGFPIEVWNPVRRIPYLVYSLLILLTAIYLAEEANAVWLMEHYRQLMFVPSDFAAGENLWTLVTAGFLHASWIHLLGNLYFLYVFGDNVEDTLGHGKFLLLYFIALVAGNLLHFAIDMDSEVPLLGASGAISGLMGVYLALFPRVKVWVVIIIIRVRLSVFWYLGFWVGYQVVMAQAGVQDVAWYAHLGGFGAGLLCGLLLRPKTRRELTSIHQV